jgi:DNA-binding MarR family transcriptional regulator
MTRRAGEFERDDESPSSVDETTVAVPDRTRLSLRIHLRLANCRNLLMGESRRSVERWGLTLAQFDALAEIARATRKGFTFGELSRLLLVTSGNLTGIVDRLEDVGLVRRQQWSKDRRVVRIVLTNKGRRLVNQISPLHARDIEQALSFLSEEQLQSLDELLSTLSDGLRAASPKQKQARLPRPSTGARSK